jgi:plastocyanin domain-containing protein
MGGQIQCTSSVGHGTKFAFTVSLSIHAVDTKTFLEHDGKEAPCEPCGTRPSPH